MGAISKSEDIIMGMNATQIVKRLRDDIIDLQKILDKRSPVSCPHLSCDECKKKQIMQDKEDDMIKMQIITKQELITEIEAS
jgi:hypothetical protein